MTEIRDRQKGCMYGLAIGDALGAAVEFREPGSFAPVKCYRGFGPHGLDAGEWTDDTSMALAMADSLKDGWLPHKQLENYVNWWENGKYSVNNWCFDIGGTTKTALWDFKEKKKTVAAHDAYSAGNGSIMRLAPLAIAYHNSDMLSKLARDSSATTHSHPDCLDSCDYLANVLADLMHGKDRDEVLGPNGVISRIKLGQKIKLVVAGTYKHEPPYIQGNGHVVKSLEAALWAFYKAQDFKECVLAAVNLGDDSDTTGAIAGQLAGAYWGFSGIPADLVDGLAKKDMIDQYLNPLLKEE